MQQENVKLMEEKAQEIKALMQSQEELKAMSAEDITELKKEQDHLVVEKAHLFDKWVKLEETVADACQYVLESTMKMDVLTRV